MAESEKMAAADFTAWCSQVEKAQGWSGREIARRLGCGVNQIKAWRENGAPAYIGLACSALLHGLPPWRAVGAPE